MESKDVAAGLISLVLYLGCFAGGLWLQYTIIKTAIVHANAEMAVEKK